MTRAALVWCTIVLGYVGGGVAAALSAPLPPPRCPSWDECLTAEWLCERTKARAWKPCRREVARCFHDADRCRGGWSW